MFFSSNSKTYALIKKNSFNSSKEKSEYQKIKIFDEQADFIFTFNRNSSFLIEESLGVVINNIFYIFNINFTEKEILKDNSLKNILFLDKKIVLSDTPKSCKVFNINEIKTPVFLLKDRLVSINNKYLIDYNNLNEKIIDFTSNNQILYFITDSGKIFYSDFNIFNFLDSSELSEENNNFVHFNKKNNNQKFNNEVQFYKELVIKQNKTIISLRGSLKTLQKNRNNLIVLKELNVNNNRNTIKKYHKIDFYNNRIYILSENVVFIYKHNILLELVYSYTFVNSNSENIKYMLKFNNNGAYLLCSSLILLENAPFLVLDKRILNIVGNILISYNCLLKQEILKEDEKYNPIEKGLIKETDVNKRVKSLFYILFVFIEDFYKKDVSIKVQENNRKEEPKEHIELQKQLIDIIYAIYFELESTVNIFKEKEKIVKIKHIELIENMKSLENKKNNITKKIDKLRNIQNKDNFSIGKNDFNKKIEEINLKIKEINGLKMNSYLSKLRIQNILLKKKLNSFNKSRFN